MISQRIDHPSIPVLLFFASRREVKKRRREIKIDRAG